MKFKTVLNPSQEEAVHSVSGPVMCIAGPGSGKTLTILYRLAVMIRQHHIEPASILVVTFTRAAAVSMRRRFLETVSGDEAKVNFGTFHSVFFHMLKRQPDYARKNIVNDETAFQMILSLLGNNAETFSSNPDIIRQLLDEIAYMKSSRTALSAYQSSVTDQETFRRIFRGYNNYLEDSGLLDFEDILNKTYELLTGNPDILRFWQNKFQYILVDEFQDINTVQYDITKLLAAPENNLFVVGDDDQSIYAFRGAAPEIMQKFPTDFPGTKMIHLDTNYRCSGAILSAASKVISNNRNRYPKQLTAFKDTGSKVIVKGFPTDREEHFYLAKLIAKELDEGTKPSEIAILCRTNSQCGAIASGFVDADIPFRMKGNIPTIYDNRYLVPVIAYIRFLAGNFSRQNFLQFCNKPVRYITRESLSEEEIDLDELYHSYEEEEKHYVSKNIGKLIYDLQMMRNLDTAAAIHYIRKVTGYEEYLKTNLNLAGNHYEEIMEYLDELEQEAVPYRSFTSFLNHISEYRKKLEALKEAPPIAAVNLTTYHGCKGLEYEFVCMPDCAEGVTPHRLSVSPPEIEEERRMFYVAMTRAKHRLYLSYSAKRHGRENKCSRFINELSPAGEKPQKGCRLYHETYKEGTVIAADGDMLTVRFDNILVPKKLSYRFCMEKGMIRLI